MSNFDSNIIKNPEIFEQNRLAAHSDHVCYKNELEKIKGKSSLRYDMNGLWKFAYAKNQSLAPCGFEAADYDCKNWDEIRVPAHIQMEGYDVPIYTNTTYPWEADESIKPGEVPEIFNPVASYVKYFTIPENMKNKRVCISFQGVESGFALWLNGHYVGYSEDTFDPSDFELTDYIIEGENKLAVRVWKWTSSSWCEDQDFYRFSGIFRDVFLYAVPCAHVEDLSVVPTLNDTFDEGTLSVSIKADGDGIASVKLYELGDLSVEKYDRAKLLLEEFDIELRNKEICEGSCNVKNPLLWSAEKPNLYEVKIIVKDTHGNETEFISQPAGFRRFEMVDGLMKLNGKRIVFKGVNRHEFSSITGRVPNRDEVIKDIVTMKKNNINAIRTSHYPDDSMLYEFCDIYGIYMIAENNLESHGTWEAYNKGYVDLDFVVPKDKPQWREMMLDRANSCYQRDKNHPAILIWSCGNESFGGKTIYEMSQLFRQLDKHRLVHYEGVFNDRSYNDTSDMESQMYTPAAGIEKFLAEHPEKPFICCEYSHSMGNSNGALFKYTDLAKREPRYQGGFIWDFIDQAVFKKNEYGESFLATGGDFDDRPTDYNFCTNGIVFADRTLTTKMAEVKYCYQPFTIACTPQGFTIRNEFLFTDTTPYSMTATLCKDGVPVAERQLPLPVIAPQTTQSFANPFAGTATEPGAYTLTISIYRTAATDWADAQTEVAFGQAAWNVVVPTTEELLPAPELIVGDVNYGIHGSDFHILFGRDKAGIVSYQKNGVERIASQVGIPRPNFWRAPIENDLGCRMPHDTAMWKIASLYAVPSIVSCKQTAHTVDIVTRYTFPQNPDNGCLVTYQFYGDGSITVTMQMLGCTEYGNMPDFGMLLQMPLAFDQIAWYGRGKDETYCDRKNGSRIGCYTSTVAEQLVPYAYVQECGNHTDTQWFTITNADGHGFRFAAEQMDFSALPYTPHQLEQAYHLQELPRSYRNVVRISAGEMGVGGDDSWGATVHPEFTRQSETGLSFTFRMTAI